MKPHRALFFACVLGVLTSPALGASPDGTWVLDSAPALTGPGIYDPVRDRMIVFSGQSLWAWSRNPARWTFVINVTPPTAGLRSAAYDPARDRMLVAQSGSASGTIDLWALSLGASPQWTFLSTSPAPGVFIGDPGARALYDPVGDRALFPVTADLGGSPGFPETYQQRIISFSLTSSTWSSTTLAQNSNMNLSGMFVVMDPVRHRLLYTNGNNFSGFSTVYSSNVEAVSLDTNTWSTVTTSSPAGVPKGSSTAAVYDPIGDRLIVTGGETWAINLSGTPAWSQIVAFYTASVRQRGTFLFDPLAHRALLIGGLGGASTLMDALELQGAPAWSALQQSPLARSNASMIDDPVRHRVILFGGASIGGGILSDTWQLTPGPAEGWSPVPATGTAPVLHSQSAIYDPLGDRMLVFGGFHTTLNGSQSNELWSLSLSNPPTWTQLAPGGPLPDPRAQHSAIYDPIRRRMIVFGGRTTSAFVSEVWSLSLDGPLQWTPLSPTGAVPARAGHLAIYDPGSDAMLVYGGNSGNSDVWSLPLATASQWNLLATSGTPPAAQGGMAGIYDPVMGRWVMLGGGSAGSLDILPKLPALSLVGPPAWTVLSPDGGVPVHRSLASAAYDPAFGEMIMFSGTGSNTADTWSIQLSQQPTAVDVSLVSADASAQQVTIEWQLSEAISGSVRVERSSDGGWETLAEMSPSSDHRVRFTDSSVHSGARYDYRLVLPGSQATAGLVTIDVPLASTLALQYAGPNPSSAGATGIWLSLPRAGSATFDLIDLSGRTVLTRDVGSLGTGRHHIALDSQTRAPGIYFARLRFEGETRTLRLVVAR